MRKCRMLFLTIFPCKRVKNKQYVLQNKQLHVRLLSCPGKYLVKVKMTVKGESQLFTLKHIYLSLKNIIVRLSLEKYMIVK